MLKMVLGLLVICAIWYVARMLWRLFSPVRTVVDDFTENQLRKHGHVGVANLHASARKGVDGFIEQPLRGTSFGRIALFTAVGAAVVAILLYGLANR